MKKPGSEPDGSETLLENVGDVTTLIMTVGIQAMLAISGELRKPKPIIKVIKNQHSKETGTSFDDFFLLTYLAHEEFLIMGDIAEKFGFSTAAATGMIDKLETLDFVERIHAIEDRRKILVKLTIRGAKFVKEMETIIGGELPKLLQESPQK